MHFTDNNYNMDLFIILLTMSFAWPYKLDLMFLKVFIFIRLFNFIFRDDKTSQKNIKHEPRSYPISKCLLLFAITVVEIKFRPIVIMPLFLDIFCNHSE